MRLHRFKKLKVNPGAKSSRFVVDLKQELAAESQEIKIQEKQTLGTKLEKLAELDYKKYFGEGRAKTKAWFLGSFTKLNDQLRAYSGATADLRPSKEVSAKPALSRTETLLDQLAFVILAKLIFLILKRVITLLYRACYMVGWLAVFCLRLIYFILLAIARPIARVLESGVSQLQPILKISAGYFRAAAVIIKKFVIKKSLRQPAPPEDEISMPVNEIIYNRPLSGYLRPVLAFAGILLIMVLPVKAYTYYKTIDSARGKVLGASESAMNNLIDAGQAAASLDFNQAGENFSQAGTNFLIAEGRLKEINGLLFTLGSIVPDKNIKLAAAGKNIVRAGALSAAAGQNLSLAVKSLFAYQASSSNAILDNLNVYGQKAVINLTALSAELEQINSEVIPAVYQRDFILLKQKIGEVKRGLSEFISLTDKLESFLGVGAAKRYLLVFQNNAELRASGGFIGSFALVDFLNGQIKSIVAPGGGSYDTDAGLLKKIKSPQPLSLVRPDWHFWDANWWPDWPTSAEKLAWFYANSDGSTVDGVIGLTPTVMEKILSIIGPIDMKDKYGVIIDADNFWRVTQEFAEQKPNVTKEPKKIIGDLMNKIIAELPRRLNKNNLIPLLKAVEELLSDKNILFYFADPETEAAAERLGWTGEIKSTAGDYLNVINTNIAGGKSDRKITQQIIHQAEIQPDGAIIDNLTIKRTHQAINREPFSGVRNVNWLRVYVPLGSKLIKAEGFKPVDKIFFKEADEAWQNDPDLARGEALALIDEASGTKIYDELGKTVFANWSQLDPGETITINIQYQLPFKLTDKKASSDSGFLDRLIVKTDAVINSEQTNLYSYSLLAQKQPGMNSSTLTSELKISPNFQPLWQYPTDLKIDQAGWLKIENFDQDKVMAVIVEEK